MAASLFQRYYRAPSTRPIRPGSPNYLTFLDRNGLAHIHTPGNDSGEFDDRLAAVAFPAAGRAA